MGVQLYVSGRFLTTGAAGEEAKPLHIFARLYPARLLMGLVALTLVTVVGAHRGGSDGLPYWLYAVVTLSILVQVAVQETGFVAIMAFFNRVADPSIGGTYMTMLNTIANLGAAWPNTAALFLIDAMHHTRPCSCEPPATAGALQALGKSIGKFIGVAVATPCKCKPEVLIDGYTTTCMLSLLIGVAWFVIVRPRLFALQALPPSAWLARRASV